MKWIDKWKAWKNGKIIQNLGYKIIMESFRETFDRGHRRRWTEKYKII
jgi:putative Mn2+ efflux pump MntP